MYLCFPLLLVSLANFVIAQDSPGLAACKAKYDDTRSVTEYQCFYYCNRANVDGLDGTVDKPDGTSCTVGQTGATGMCKSGSCTAPGSTTPTPSPTPPSNTPFDKLHQCRKVFPRTVSATRNICRIQCKLPGGKVGNIKVPNGIQCRIGGIGLVNGKCEDGICLPNL